SESQEKRPVRSLLGGQTSPARHRPGARFARLRRWRSHLIADWLAKGGSNDVACIFLAEPGVPAETGGPERRASRRPDRAELSQCSELRRRLGATASGRRRL